MSSSSRSDSASRSERSTRVAIAGQMSRRILVGPSALLPPAGGKGGCWLEPNIQLHRFTEWEDPTEVLAAYALAAECRPGELAPVLRRAKMNWRQRIDEAREGSAPGETVRVDLFAVDRESLRQLETSAAALLNGLERFPFRHDPLSPETPIEHSHKAITLHRVLCDTRLSMTDLTWAAGVILELDDLWLALWNQMSSLCVAKGKIEGWTERYTPPLVEPSEKL